MKAPAPPSWPQVITLVLAVAGGSGLTGMRAAEAAAPATISRAQHDDAALVEALGELKKDLKDLNATVQSLSTQIAVINDRQKRSGR